MSEQPFKSAAIFVDDGFPEASEYDSNFFRYRVDDPADFQRALKRAQQALSPREGSVEPVPGASQDPASSPSNVFGRFFNRNPSSLFELRRPRERKERKKFRLPNPFSNPAKP